MKIPENALQMRRKRWKVENNLLSFPNKSLSSLNNIKLTTNIKKKPHSPCLLELLHKSSSEPKMIFTLIANPEKLFVLWKTPAASFQLAKHFDQPHFFFVLASPRRAAHSLAEWGTGCHLLGEDERDLASSTRLLAAGGNRDVSLTAVARAMTSLCLFSYQPAEAQRNKSTRQPELSKQQSVSAPGWCRGSCCSLFYGN